MNAVADKLREASHEAAKRLRRPATIASLYAALAIFTFGHVAAAPRECISRDSGKVYPCRAAQVAIVALFGGLAWPLYWSWEAQS